MTIDVYSPLEMINTLIGFDTTSRESNMELINFVKKYLSSHGVDSIIIPDPKDNKANLYATLGPPDVSGIVLSGHTDVVPVDGQKWSSDPFDTIKKDGRIYGRGTADMKSFIAIALALVPEFLTRPLNTPIHLALSYDEEIGCLGAPHMIAKFNEINIIPKVCIVGEPTKMRVVNSHKGVCSYKTTVLGLEQHSSATHLGVNAVEYASKLVCYLTNLSEEIRDLQTKSMNKFEPPYTTIHVGTIHGGTAQNIIPKKCTFSWEYRLIPGEDPNAIYNQFQEFSNEKLLPLMKQVSDEADIITTASPRVPGLLPEKGSIAEELVLNLAKQNQTHAVSYGTEAGQYQTAGIPTVICGPGNIAQAHKPDEFIEISQIEECTAFMRRLRDYCQS